MFNQQFLFISFRSMQFFVKPHSISLLERKNVSCVCLTAEREQIKTEKDKDKQHN